MGCICRGLHRIQSRLRGEAALKQLTRPSQLFLRRFVGTTPWAHIDIAGMAWSNKGNATTPKGATAYGVRLLDKLVADNYER